MMIMSAVSLEILDASHEMICSKEEYSQHFHSLHGTWAQQINDILMMFPRKWSQQGAERDGDSSHSHHRVERSSIRYHNVVRKECRQWPFKL